MSEIQKDRKTEILHFLLDIFDQTVRIWPIFLHSGIILNVSTGCIKLASQKCFALFDESKHFQLTSIQLR